MASQISNDNSNNLQAPLEFGHSVKESHEGASLWLRIVSVLIYVGCLIVNGVIGVAGPNSAGAVSDKFKLYVTPPGFIFSIWGAIYTFIGITIIYVTIANKWRPVSYYLWNAINFFNALWVGIWSIGTQNAIIACLFIIITLPTMLLWLWYTIYEPEVDSCKEGWKYYLVRNSIAFYLGWVIAATIINFGIVLVYPLQVAQKTFTVVFWIVVPVVAITVTVVNFAKQRWNGLLSCLCAWLSVLWALSGALITTLDNKNNL